MPAVYDKLGIRFHYPENWTLDESEALEGEKSVSVYSPGGAFWSVIVHPPTLDPQALANAALDTMKQVYDELDTEPVVEAIANCELVGCDMNFYCLDLTNTAQVRAFRRAEATYLVMCQADDREFAEVEPVFRAMLLSLLR